MKPVYAELAAAFAHASDSLVIANVDADAHKDIGAKYDVKGFPTLKWFPKGAKVPESYNGGRELDDLAAFITQKTGIQSKIVKPLTFVKEISDSEFDAVVKVCCSWFTLDCTRLFSRSLLGARCQYSHRG